MEQGRALWGELTEDHVEIGDCRKRDRGGDRQPERDLDGPWEVPEAVCHPPGDRRLGDPTEAEAGQRDAQLAGREQRRDVRCSAKAERGQTVAFGRTCLQPGAPRADQRELGADEEPVQAHERYDGEHAGEHKRKVLAMSASHHGSGPGRGPDGKRDGDGSAAGDAGVDASQLPHGHAHAHGDGTWPRRRFPCRRPRPRPFAWSGVGHHHLSADSDTRGLKIALVLTAVFLVAEVVGGVFANSLALLCRRGPHADRCRRAGLSLFVAWFSREPETPQKTYGYLRWEILAAFFNGATLLVISALDHLGGGPPHPASASRSRAV